MKYTFSVTIAESKGTCHITVKDGDSEFRVYSGRNTLARTVAGVVHKFWLKHKEKEAAQEKGSGAISVQQTEGRLVKAEQNYNGGLPSLDQNPPAGGLRPSAGRWCKCRAEFLL